MKWQTGVLPTATVRALDFFSQASWLRGSHWYLAGGTALALQVGHRSSEDLDFFTSEKTFAVNDVLQYITEPSWRTTDAEDGTIYGEYLGAKTSFIAYPFFVSKEPKISYGHISVLSLQDIAVMKIVAISQRGRKRDFVDLYWYSMNEESLVEVVKRLPDQYPSVAHDYHHILKAMLYFEDAENDPMLKLNFKADWQTVKAYFRREVPKIAESLLKLKP